MLQLLTRSRTVFAYSWAVWFGLLRVIQVLCRLVDEDRVSVLCCVDIAFLGESLSLVLHHQLGILLDSSSAWDLL